VVDWAENEALTLTKATISAFSTTPWAGLGRTREGKEAYLGEFVVEKLEAGAVADGPEAVVEI
jgi:hypothetical protein